MSSTDSRAATVSHLPAAPAASSRRPTSAARVLRAAGRFASLHEGFGWLRPERPWPEASGWDEIRETERPRTTSHTHAGYLWQGPDAPRLHWLGHSGFLLRFANQRLLIDPHLGNRCTISRRRLACPVTAEQLTEIDAVLLTHAHFDHLHLPTLAALPSPGRFVVPAGCEGYLQSLTSHGAVVDSVLPGENFLLDDLEVCVEAARHHGGRWHPFRAAAPALSYVVRRAGVEAATGRPFDAVYLAGDTAYGDHFRGVRRHHAPRAAVLPIGAYAPRWPLRHHHMNPEEAVCAALELNVETVVPCHFGTFTLSFDHPAAALPRFAHAASCAGLQWQLPRLLAPAAASPMGGAVDETAEPLAGTAST